MWGESARGVRWILNHIRGLPEDSRYVQAIAGYDRMWTSMHALIADLFDITAVTASQHETKKPVDYPRPKRVESDVDKPAVATKEEMLAFFGASGKVRVNVESGR